MVVRTQYERDRNAEFGSIGKQADHEYDNVPRTRVAQVQSQGVVQVQSQGVVQTEDRYNRRAYSDVMVARNKGEHRDEERIHKTCETASCESSRGRLGTRTHDLPRFERDDDE